MKDEKKIVESVQPTAIATVSAENKAETISPVRKTALFGDQNEAIRAGIKNGRCFELLRLKKKVPSKVPGNKPQYFYEYVVCVVLRGIVPFKFLHVLPVSDYISKDDSIKKRQQNSVSYANLNFLYDLGNGLDLIIREDKSSDNYDRKDPKWRFYAVAVDEDGLTAEFEVVPKTAGDRQFLLSAFAGFGRLRSFTWDDVKNDKPEGIRAAIEPNYLAPGELPDDVDSLDDSID